MQGATGSLAGAAWSADSRAVVVAQAGSRQLAVLYLMQDPPGLEAQLFPLPLPQLPGQSLMKFTMHREHWYFAREDSCKLYLISMMHVRSSRSQYFYICC